MGELGDLVKNDNTWKTVQRTFTAPVVDGDLELKLSEILAREDIVFTSLVSGITLTPTAAVAKSPTASQARLVSTMGWTTTNTSRDVALVTQLASRSPSASPEPSP